MKGQKRLKIMVQTSRLVIRRSKDLPPVWCRECSSTVQCLTPEEAALAENVSTRAIYRWIEAEQLHLIEAAAQGPLICLNSLRILTDKV